MYMSIYNEYTRMNGSLFVVVVGLLLIQTSVAQTSCSFASTASECYNLRDYCRYDIATSTCISGAPPSCDAFKADKVGCQIPATFGLAACRFPTGATQCYNSQYGCSAFIKTQCHLRPDCVYNTLDQTCVTGTSVCRAYTNSNDCLAANCFYDTYINTCSASRSEVTTRYPCSYWTGFPGASEACQYHGCDYTSSVCQDIGSGVGLTDNSTTITSEFTSVWTSAAIAPNTLTMSVSVITPLQVRLNPAFRTYIFIGATLPGFGPTVVPSACNNVGELSYKPPSSITTTLTKEQLTTAFINHVNTKNNYDFNVSTPAGAALFQVFGNITTNTIMPAISTDSLQTSLITYLQFDLSVMYAKCPGITVTTSITNAKDRTYTVDVTVAQWSSSGGWMFATKTMYGTVLASGTIGFVGASRYYEAAYLQQQLVSTSYCPARNESAMQWTVRLEFRGVYDPTLSVGPRSLADILKRSPLSIGVVNCYGDEPISLETLPCVNGVCYTYVTFRSRCRGLPENGQGFNECKYAKYDDRVLDLGNPAATYPLNLNKQHSFFMNVWSCPVGNLTSASCLLMVQSAQAYPDAVYVEIGTNVYPDQPEVTVSMDVELCLLPTPTSTTSNCQMLSSYLNRTLINGNDLFNAQIQQSKALSPYIQLVSPSLRTSFDLRIINITITPVTAAGVTLQNTPVLQWSHIASVSTRVMKNELTTCRSCALLNAVQNNPGSDGFSISVADLKSKSPANGYNIQIAYAYTWPTASQTPQGSPSRILLSVSDGTGTEVTGSVMFQYMMMADNSTMNATTPIANTTIAPTPTPIPDTPIANTTITPTTPIPDTPIANTTITPTATPIPDTTIANTTAVRNETREEVRDRILSQHFDAAGWSQSVVTTSVFLSYAMAYFFVTKFKAIVVCQKNIS